MADVESDGEGDRRERDERAERFVVAMLSNPAWGQINAKLLDGEDECRKHCSLLARVAEAIGEAIDGLPAAKATRQSFPRFNAGPQPILMAMPGGRPN